MHRAAPHVQYRTFDAFLGERLPEALRSSLRPMERFVQPYEAECRVVALSGKVVCAEPSDFIRVGVDERYIP